MKKRHSVMLMGIMISLTAAILLLSGFGPQSQAAALADRVSAADKQLDSLVRLADMNTDGSYISVVKWQGEWKTALSMEQAADQLAEQLGFNSPAPQDVQEHTVYTAEGNIDGIQGKLSVMEMEGGLYIVLLLNGSAETAGLIREAQHEAGALLLKAGVDANWNGAVQGLAGAKSEGQVLGSGKAASEYKAADPAQTIKRLEASVQGLGLKPSAIDAFEDGTTVSRTYDIPSFSIKAAIGVHGKSGLQIGVHTDTVTGREQISFGSPMLTIEY